MLEVFENSELVARAAANRFTSLAASAIKQQGRFSVALSGGQTPKRVYELLASDEFKDQINWRDVHIFFGDERPVPPDHPASNYGMALATLISKVSIPPINVHRIIGEAEPQTSARLYETELKAFFTGATWPRFDLVFLGMGEDGHTASLFPGTAALKEHTAWVVANWVERLGEFRITFTAPAINAAANILFLVTGEKKAALLAEVLRGPYEPERLPAQLVKPDAGSLVWMVDAEAERMVWVMG